MKIHYNAPRGQRIKKQFFSVELEDYQLPYIFDCQKRQWITTDEWIGIGKENGWSFANFQRVDSLKSAIRAVKKANVPIGTRFVLDSRFGRKGNSHFYDVIITK